MSNPNACDDEDTIVMTKEELEILLGVDSAMTEREHERPTVTMSAVKPG